MEGLAASILVGERVALNFLQHMSGVATATAAMVKAVHNAGHSTTVLETRKTVPGLRVIEKWAVLIGGGSNHRMGLYDMMMIKDNHIAAAGGITAAVRGAEAYIREHELQGMQVEVETSTLEEVQEALDIIRQKKEAGEPPVITRIMLDNMAKAAPELPGGVDVSLLQQAVALIGGAVDTEASGNVTLSSAAAVASTGVTFFSCGALTHSAPALDISLKIKLL